MSEVKFTSKIPYAISVINGAAVTGAQEGMKLVYDKSQEIVPLDETPLQKSGKQFDNSTEFYVSYGYGESAEYAVLQHENLWFRHLPGRQAKYLEQPFRELTPRIIQIIGDKVKKVC